MAIFWNLSTNFAKRVLCGINNGMNEKMSLETIAALLPYPDREQTRQAVFDRRKKSGDKTTMTTRYAHNLAKEREDLWLRCIALTSKRFEFLHDYYSKHGKYPSGELIIESVPHYYKDENNEDE